MKKNKEFPYLALALLVVWCPLFMGAWDKDKPSSSTSLRNSNPEILANWSALETALAQDHEFSTGGTNSGKHEVLTMEEESSAGASSTNELHVQAIDGGSGQPEFAITSEDGNELQMTKDGDLFSSAGLTVTTNATFNGGITLGAGDDLIGSATSDITFNTNKFTVAGDTGNTVIAGTLAVAGTLDVTGNIDPTSYETTNGGFLDEDAMGSNSATKVASQQSIKAYIDALIASKVTLSAYTNQDSESNTMLKSHAYKAATDGYVKVLGTPNTTNQYIRGYVGTTNDPVGAGNYLDAAESSINILAIGIGLFVAEDEYFEIRSTMGGSLAIYWKSLGTLSKPVDQD